MKIKLRSDDSGPPGPTEWSEMNDWLANLREDADPEPAAEPGPSSTAEPQSWAHVPAPTEPHDGPATGERPTPQTWGPGDPAQSWQPASDPAPSQSWGPRDSSVVQPLSAAVPVPDGSTAARPYGAAQSQDTAEPAAMTGPPAVGVTAEPYGASEAYAVDEPYGSAALDAGDGFYGHYGDYELDGGHSGPSEAEAAVTTVPSDTTEAAVTGEAGVARVADEARAAREAGAPDAGVAGETPVTDGSAGPVAPAAPAAPKTFGASWAPAVPVAPTYAAGPVTPEAWMAPVTSGAPAVPTFAARPVAPEAPVASAPPALAAGPETVVGALIGADLRTPMVWCELEPGSCVSWHGDREALGMADVRARAIAAGWRIDALGRLTCPQCQQRSTTFRATQQVVPWNRGYAMTMAAREAARQGNYAYPQPAFYPR
jgi:hypothetical protein